MIFRKHVVILEIKYLPLPVIDMRRRHDLYHMSRDRILFMLLAFFILSGLVIGSFSNVVIYRVPLIQESTQNVTLSYPPSHCPECKASLRIKDNIPLLSYVLKKGHCTYCYTKIPIDYFLVELLTVVFYIAICLTSHSGIMHAISNCLMVSFFIVIAIIDIKHQKIYDVILLGLFVCILTELLLTSGKLLQGIVYMGIVYLSLLFFTLLMSMLLGKTSLGLGDVKYLSVIAIWSGLPGILIILFTACCLTIIGVCLMRNCTRWRSRVISEKYNGRIPFGPGICTACLVMLFVQPYIDCFDLCA